MTVAMGLSSLRIHLLFLRDKIKSYIKMGSSRTSKFQSFLSGIKTFRTFFKTILVFFGCGPYKPFLSTFGENPIDEVVYERVLYGTLLQSFVG